MNSSALLATENLSIFDPVSPAGESIRGLSIFVTAVCAGIFLVVEIILIYAISRFRRRPGTPGTEPPQVYGSAPIEIAWTAAPGLIVFVLVLVTARTLWETAPPPPKPKEGDDAVFVTVVGRQWWWEYHYTHHNGKPIRADGDADLITANELVMPASEPAAEGRPARPRRTYLRLTSADVAHSYWVPRLHGKTDLIPGKKPDNATFFETSQAGLYLGQCAEYCGTQHAHMDFYVKAVSQADYAAFVSAFQGGPVTPAAGSPEANGQQVFKQAGCSGCHAIGAAPQGAVLIGPNLTHFGSRGTIAGAVLTNTPTNLKEWILHAQDVKPGADMPSFDGSAAPTYRALSQSQVDDLVAYLESLK